MGLSRPRFLFLFNSFVFEKFGSVMKQILYFLILMQSSLVLAKQIPVTFSEGWDRVLGRIQAVDGTVCSGAMVDTYTVLTAAHCVAQGV